MDSAATYYDTLTVSPNPQQPARKEIGAPQNFQHTVHVGCSADTGLITIRINPMKTKIRPEVKKVITEAINHLGELKEKKKEDANIPKASVADAPDCADTESLGAPSFSAPSYCEVSGSSYKSGTSKECVEVSKASEADCAAVSVRERAKVLDHHISKTNLQEAVSGPKFSWLVQAGVKLM